MHIHQDSLLIVDDNPVNRKVLARQMESQGYEVICVEDGYSALDIVRSRQLDLVLLDIMMPEIDGMEVLRQLRAEQTMSQLPVIMVTARDQTEDVVEALELGANDYLVKPVDLPVALAKIRTHLSFKRSEEALRESEERYVLAANGARDGLWDWDLLSGEVYYSGRWKAMLGYEDAEIGISTDDWRRLVHEDDLPILDKLIDDHLSGKIDVFLSEHRMLHKDGSYRWILSRGKALINDEGKAYRMAGSNTDMTDLKVYDPLTGLPNKTLLLDRIERSKRRNIRQHNEQVFAVMVMNLDRFKEINDRMGYSVGDQILVAVTRRLKDTLRSADTVAYLGKDEFAILFDGLNDCIDAVRATARVQDQLMQPVTVGDQEISVVFSAGLSTCEDEQSAEQMFHEAYTAMVRAKNNGGDSFEVYDTDIHSTAAKQVKLENDLRHSIDRQQLYLEYHSIQSLSDQKVIGYESLTRWEYGESGAVEPLILMTAAERTGMISAIDQWAIAQALKELDNAERLKAGEQLYINVSGRPYAARKLVEAVRACVRESTVDPKNLHLEFFETGLFELMESAPEILDQLHAVGLNIGINAFGEGMVSLNLLQSPHVNYIKLASSLLLRDDKEAASMLAAIQSAAEQFGVRVIAVGVENEKQLEKLNTLGIKYAQGFHWSQPKPVDQL